MAIVSRKLSFNIYYISLLIFVLLMCWGRAMVTISVIVCLAAWLFDGHFKDKWQQFYQRKELLLLLSFYIFHLIGITYSANTANAINDVVMKLPYFIMVIIIGTMPSFTQSETNQIYGVAVASIVANTIFCYLNFIINSNSFANIRDISIFMSHIRLSMYVLISIVILFHLASNESNRRIKYIEISAIVWQIIFMLILKSITGLIILLVLVIIFMLKNIYNRNTSINLKASISTILLLIICLPIYLIISEASYFYHPKESLGNQTEYTASGNPYDRIDNYTIENGYYMSNYICSKELEEEWNKVSKLDYNSQNAHGDYIKYTLFRYMTSLGLHKDKEGFAKLTAEDIYAIENDIANYRFTQKSIRNRIYEIVWEIYMYQKGDNPSGHSVTQRFEFAKCAIATIKDNLLFGVGSGDILDEMQIHYDKINSQLDKTHRLMPHNQILTLLIQFGIVGFLIITICAIKAIKICHPQNNIISCAAILILTISIFNEDVIENQAGLTFAIIFIFLQILATNPQYKDNEIAIFSIKNK